jgi:hypothetical protein
MENPVSQGTESESKRKRGYYLPVGLTLILGIVLGAAIGYQMPERFEKTTNLNIRFDTRTKQNCWTGPAVNPFDAVDSDHPYLPLPLCKNL